MQKIPVAMIGGGPQSMIGQTHRNALTLSGKYELVAGCFSPSMDKNQHIADILKSPLRIYADWAEMLEVEAAREDGARVVIIVTPDHLHYANCKAALENNFHVICDKPLCEDKNQAEELFTLAQEKNKRLEVTYTISGEPTYRHFKQYVQSKDFGSIQQIEAVFMAGWGNGLPEKDESHPMHKQAWRFKKGQGLGALGDIGTHIFEYAHQLTQEKPQRLTAQLQKLYEERELNDGGQVLLCYPHNLLVNIRFSLSLNQDDGYKITANSLEYSTLYVVGNDYFSISDNQGECRKIETPIADLAPDYKLHLHLLEKDTEETQSKFNNIWCFKNLYDDFAIAIHNEQAYRAELEHAGLNGMKFVSYAEQATHEKSWVDWE